MTSGSSGNVMTEVALALAMAFFSLMVLTMVSMGTPQANPSQKTESATTQPKMKVAMASDAKQKPEKGPAKTTLIVFWKGAFLDRNLQELDLTTQNYKGRVILALPPDLPMAEALDARAKIKAGNLMVSALNDRWLDRLSQSAR